MDIEEIKDNLKKISISNTINSNVAKTTLDYIENIERELINRNNKIEQLLLDAKSKQDTIDIMSEVFL